MAIRIVPYSAEHIEAARAFNDRLKQGGRAEIVLPDDPPEPPGPERVIRAVYNLALEDDAVRGGFVICNYPAWLEGETITAGDCIAPLSEGIVNPKYGMLAMHFLKFLQQQTPYGFAVGMGADNNPYPRLLKASGWRILTAPFFFRVFRGGRFFREMRILRRSQARRLAASIASATGLGSVAMWLLQWRAGETRLAARGLTIETIAEWGDWADAIWDQFKTACSFATLRDARTLSDLYNTGDPAMNCFLLRRDGRPIAWAAALNTRMRDNQYFGDLQVATILDCVGASGDLAPAIDLVSRELAKRGADLVLTNQTHSAMQSAFSNAGFQRGPSNYILGVSKTITERVRGGRGEAAIHITRGDGDGRMHL
jgi:hypothetical protein